jgi:hypothetical protein
MTIFAIAASGLAGTMLGLGYFAALHRTATLVAGGFWLRPAGLTIARLAAAAAGLGVAARIGAPALLAAFAGFLLARAIALRLVRREA